MDAESCYLWYHHRSLKLPMTLSLLQISERVQVSQDPIQDVLISCPPYPLSSLYSYSSMTGIKLPRKATSSVWQHPNNGRGLITVTTAGAPLTK
jgi:hypothetical protein